MNKIRIKDIYAGVPDARDEVHTDFDKFLKSFLLPPGLQIERLLSGEKYFIAGDKGTGKTSVLYYLQKQILNTDECACTSFIYFKSDFEEIKKSRLESIAKGMTAIIDLSGEIQPNKVEYLHIWRWVFFKKIVEDTKKNTNNLFIQNNEWDEFEKEVNKIKYRSADEKVISLSSLAISISASSQGIQGSVNANFEKISNSEKKFNQLIDIVEKCEELFEKLERTDIPYYLFVDEIEAFYSDKEIYLRDLTLIRDLLFTVHRLNEYKKVKIIAAVRNEILYAMGKNIPTNELNKITEGFSIPIKWSYNNTTSYDHPIIQILMKRISVAANGVTQKFDDWFPPYINKKETVNYILDNGWNKPRDIVRFLIAAQNDTLHCNDTRFTQAAIESLRREYSKNSLNEIRQELQSLYTVDEIESVLRLVRGKTRSFTAEELMERAKKVPLSNDLFQDKFEEIITDFYRVGFWGNCKFFGNEMIWHWNYKGDSDAIIGDGWKLIIHSALWKELLIAY